MKEILKYYNQMNNLPENILASQVENERTEILSVEITNGQITGSQNSDITECFIRTMIPSSNGNKIGLYYTQNLEEDPLKAILQAAQNAKCASSQSEEFFITPDLAYQTPNVQENKINLSWSEIKQKALNIENTIKTKNPNSEIKIIFIKTILTKEIVNSLGVQIESNTIRYEIEMDIAENENGTQYYNSYSCSSTNPDKINAEFFENKIDKWRKFRLKTTNLQAGEYPTVLDCEVTANIFATAWQLFTAKNYLAGSTPYANMLDKEVFSKSIVIENLPTIPDGGYEYIFDCEGTKVTKTVIGENGKLKSLLHTQQSAKQMNKTPTGTAWRKALLSGTIHTDLIPVPTNFRIENGNKTTQDLLKQMQNGIYVFESFDVFHSINIASGEFHIPCKAILIENGQMKSLAQSITINGTIQQLLKDVTEVGNNICVRPMDLLKSYTVSTPDFLVKNLKFTGN